jgi:uncharacterized lipoprotein YajG
MKLKNKVLNMRTIGIVILVIAIGFSMAGCGDPEGTVTVTNATDLTEYSTLIVIIKEGSEEVARQDVRQNASVSFTLPVGDYTLQAGTLFTSVSKSIPVYNKSDRKYRITNLLGVLILP